MLLSDTIDTISAIKGTGNEITSGLRTVPPGSPTPSSEVQSHSKLCPLCGTPESGTQTLFEGQSVNGASHNMEKAFLHKKTLGAI